MKHQDIAGIFAVHPFAFVGSTDPSLDADNEVAAYKAWIDTTDGFVLKIRNATNDGWDTVGEAAATRDTVTALSTSGTVNIDYSLGDYFTLALSGNVTSITFSNLPGSGKGGSLIIRITQDATPRTVAWPASFRWEGGVAGTVSTGSGVVDILALTTVDNGTTWHATLSKARA